MRLFRKQTAANKSAFRRFLTKIEKNPPKRLDQLTSVTDVEVWKQTDCLSCANCCKTMSPTFTAADIRRIAGHLGIRPSAFREKYLYKDKEGDWINKSQPCQFLNPADNKCSIYEVRPLDCSGFPHHTKKKVVDYIHVYKQNVEYCPATYRFVDLLRRRLESHI